MSNAKILVADDEVQFRNVVAYKFRNAGLEVITACDGAEALELAETERPDLMIVDYQMPELDGLQLCSRLRQQADTASIPVILLTAHGMNMDETLFEQAGVTVLMAKPFSPRELLARAKELLSESQTVAPVRG